MRRIIVVINDPGQREAVRSTLSSGDIEVQVADTAVEAAALALDPPADLLILPLDADALAAHERLALADVELPVIYIASAGAGELRSHAETLESAAILDEDDDHWTICAETRRTLLSASTRVRPGRRHSTMTVLVVVADTDNSEKIKRSLQVPGRESIEAEFCPTVAEAAGRLADQRYDCVVLDHDLDDGIGIDLLDDAEEHLLTTPVIGLSSGAEAPIAVEYFRHGCSEFFRTAEALREDTLRRGIANAVSKFQRQAMATIIERKQLRDAIVGSQERLITLARVDHLTGICNRAVYDDLHPQFHEETVARDCRYAVCMIDVDNFKSYNDLYGHAAGDDALKRVADAVSESLRDEDFVARYGGEEFVALLDDVTPENALIVAERMRRRVFEAEIPHAGNGVIGRLTVSIGVAVFGDRCRLGPKPLRIRADEALYRAKDAGRNAVVLASDVPAVESTETESRLIGQ